MPRIRHVDGPTLRHTGDASRLDPITRAPTDAAPVRIRDVLLVCWSDASGDDRDFPPVRRPVSLGRNLRLVGADNEEAELIVNACLPRGHYFFPTWQGPFLYMFEREVDVGQYGNRFDWDADATIKTALQLSRLVVDNGYSAEFAARIIDHEDAQQQIVPHVMHLFRFMPTYRLRSDRDWLTEADAGALEALIAAYWANMRALPPRVARALSLSEGVVHSGVLERALVLMMMGLEALLNTHAEKVSKQIISRLPLLASELGIPRVTNTFARQMYHDRSRPAHGQELRLPAWTANGADDGDVSEISPDYLAKLARLHDLLRATIRRAIEEPAFACIFRDESTIRRRWPVTIDGVDY